MDGGCADLERLYLTVCAVIFFYSESLNPVRMFILCSVSLPITALFSSPLTYVNAKDLSSAFQVCISESEQ